MFFLLAVFSSQAWKPVAPEAGWEDLLVPTGRAGHLVRPCSFRSRKIHLDPRGDAQEPRALLGLAAPIEVRTCPRCAAFWAIRQWLPALPTSVRVLAGPGDSAPPAPPRRVTVLSPGARVAVALRGEAACSPAEQQVHDPPRGRARAAPRDAPRAGSRHTSSSGLRGRCAQRSPPPPPPLPNVPSPLIPMRFCLLPGDPGTSALVTGADENFGPRTPRSAWTQALREFRPAVRRGSRVSSPSPGWPVREEAAVTSSCTCRPPPAPPPAVSGRPFYGCERRREAPERLYGAREFN